MKKSRRKSAKTFGMVESEIQEYSRVGRNEKENFASGGGARPQDARPVQTVESFWGEKIRNCTLSTIRLAISSSSTKALESKTAN